LQEKKKYYKTYSFSPEKYRFSGGMVLRKTDYVYDATYAYWWLRNHIAPEKKFLIGKHTELRTGTGYFKFILKGKSYLFTHSEVREVRCVHQKLMLPLIFGGISTPLFFVSLLKSGIFNNWFALILAMFASVFLVVGFQGKERIEVVTESKSYFFESFGGYSVRKIILTLDKSIKKRKTQ
jgi:hypothetical protein